MGLFSFFSKKKEEPAPQVKRGTMPTVRSAPKRVDAYEKVFYAVMSDVNGFTPEEFDEMVRIIVAGEGGHMNMGRYYRPIFDQFFAGRHWTWAEYEFWERMYAKLGQKPLRFQPGLAVPADRTIVLTAQAVLNDLKVAELREFFESHNISIPPKAKKRDLLELAESIPNLRQTQLWKKKEEPLQGTIGYPLYELLMRYIAFKANGVFEGDRAMAVGATQFKHLFIEAGDEKFVDLALKRNPKALPPYFPGDVTMRQAVIPGFD